MEDYEYGINDDLVLDIEDDDTPQQPQSVVATQDVNTTAPTSTNERLAQLQQNTATARQAYADAQQRVGEVAKGNAPGYSNFMAELNARYGKKETPEEAASRQRREKVESNALAWTNMLQGVANVLTASGGTTGRSVKPVDVAKAYQDGINTAEAKRNANEDARKKAQEAYLDKELSKARLDANTAYTDYKTQMAAEDAERKRQADANEKKEKRAFDMWKAANDWNFRANENAKNRAQKDRIANKNASISQERNDIMRYRAEHGGGSGSDTHDTFYYGGNTQNKIEIPKVNWSKDKGTPRKTVLEIIKKENKEWLDEYMKRNDIDSENKIKDNQFSTLIGEYIFSEDASSPVVDALYDIAGVPEKDRPKVSFAQSMAEYQGQGNASQGGGAYANLKVK